MSAPAGDRAAGTSREPSRPRDTYSPCPTAVPLAVPDCAAPLAVPDCAIHWPCRRELDHLIGTQPSLGDRHLGRSRSCAETVPSPPNKPPSGPELHRREKSWSPEHESCVFTDRSSSVR